MGLKIGRIVSTKMGRGEVKKLENGTKCVVQFEWGSATIKVDDIFDVDMANREEKEEWEKYPEHVMDSKAKAAGILGGASVVSKALKNFQDSSIDQLMQHLVLLQSQKIKAKVAHLEDVSSILQREREEIEAMKEELFRERVLIAKERLTLTMNEGK